MGEVLWSSVVRQLQNYPIKVLPFFVSSFESHCCAVNIFFWWVDAWISLVCCVVFRVLQSTLEWLGVVLCERWNLGWCAIFFLLLIVYSDFMMLLQA